MPRIILTKVPIEASSSTTDENVSSKRENPNSEYVEDSNISSKKPRYESISTSMDKMVISENNGTQVSNDGYLVPPNKDTNGFAKTFPQRLMDMISYKGSEGIITWTKEGTAFNIVDENELSKKLLPLFFKRTKFLSFIRKINRWGFKRVLSGENTGAFYHEFFLRDQPQRCLYMDCHHSSGVPPVKESGKDSCNIAKNNAFPKAEASPSLSSRILSQNTTFPPSLLPNYSPQFIQNSIKNTNKIESTFDAHTRRILSNSVLAKSMYHDRIRFRNQLFSKSIAQNALTLGSVRGAIAPPQLPAMVQNNKVYTAHDIAAAKLLLSSRKQGSPGIQFLANKLSTKNFPRKQNNVAARLA